MNSLVPIPVLLPLLGAAITLMLARHPRAQRLISAVVLAADLSIAAVLLVLITLHGAPVAVSVGGWPAPIGIVLVADQLSTLMLIVSTAVTMSVMAYSIGEGVAEHHPNTPVAIFYPTYLVLVAGVSDAFLSGDLFNLFVGFEILLSASYVLLSLGGTGLRVRVAPTYVVISLLSSLIFLIAIGLTYAATGTVNLAQLAGRLDALPGQVQLVLHLMLLLAFGIKSAVFPLSTWLPDSYPSAPAPVTAVFAGLLTKVGIYAIIRSQTLLFPGGSTPELLLVAGVLTMIVGILGAVVQADLKRLLSFTLVSHIGFLLFGIGLASTTGLASAIYYVVHHITIQTTLFLVAGLIERRTGTTSLVHMGGLAKTVPLLAVLYLIPALNLAGIPPFSGFLGELGLLQAGVAAGTPLAWLLVGGSVLTSLLTLYAMTKVWSLIFWRTPPQQSSPTAQAATAPASARIGLPPAGPGSAGPPPAGPAGAGLPLPAGLVDPGRPAPTGLAHPELPAPGESSAEPVTAERSAGMVAPTAVLVALGLSLTVFAGPLFDLTTHAAGNLRLRTPYITAVFPGGTP